MAFSPDLFLANYAVHADFSKSAKFAAYIFPPASMMGNGAIGNILEAIGGKVLGFKGVDLARKIEGAADAASLSFQCESAELPGYNLNLVESKVYGAAYHVAATPVFNDLNLSFICSGTLWEKKFFDSWMDLILPKISGNSYGYLANYRDNYVSRIKVVQFTDIGVPSMTIDYIDAFPYTVAPLQTNWGDDGIHRLQVTFKYKHWERKTLVDDIKGIASTVKSFFPLKSGSVTSVVE